MLDYENLYQKAIELYNNEPKESRQYLERCLDSEEYKQKVLIQLIRLYLKENKLDKARKLLREKKLDTEKTILATKQIQTQLDMMEYNYDTCKKDLYDLFTNSEYYKYATFHLARLYSNLGDLSLARKMYETLMFLENPDEENMLQQVYIDIILKDYNKAYETIKKIDEKNLNHMYRGNLFVIRTYVENKLGIFNKKLVLDPANNYGTYTALYDDEQAVINHINRHLANKEKDNDGCFFKYTDVKRLLNEARDRIEYMNPSYRRYSSTYRFKLDDPIGFSSGGLTNDLCVITMIGTKKIVTMYPVKLSDEFNKEGYLTKKLETK